MSTALLSITSLPTQAKLVTFEARLSGSAEVPANASPATGLATVIFDTQAHTMDVDVSFSGLLGNTSEP